MEPADGWMPPWTVNYWWISEKRTPPHLDASLSRVRRGSITAVPVDLESSADLTKFTNQMTISMVRRGRKPYCLKLQNWVSLSLRYMTICNYVGDDRSECPEKADDSGFDGYYPWLDDICGGVEPCLDCVPWYLICRCVYTNTDVLQTKVFSITFLEC